MNGRDVADAQVTQQHLAALHGLLDWIKAMLVDLRTHERPLTPFERELLRRVEKIEEM